MKAEKLRKADQVDIDNLQSHVDKYIGENPESEIDRRTPVVLTYNASTAIPKYVHKT